MKSYDNIADSFGVRIVLGFKAPHAIPDFGYHLITRIIGAELC